MVSYPYVCLQMQEEEQELTSVVELEELRKSLGDDHSFLLPSTPHDLDASWVIHEEMDASTGFTDGGAKKNCPDNTARISPALSAQSKGPRMRCAQSFCSLYLSLSRVSVHMSVLWHPLSRPLTEKPTQRSEWRADGQEGRAP